MRPVTSQFYRTLMALVKCGVSIAAVMCLWTLLSPVDARADCVQIGNTVNCDGFTAGGFVSVEDSLSVTITESGIIRNIVSLVRNGVCPLSLPAIVTGSSSNITNDGLILTFGVCGSGIQADSGANVINRGIIETVDPVSFGINVGANSTILNEGSIITREFFSAAVLTGDGSTVTNAASGLIETDGLIGTGVNGRSGSSVFNAGTIRTNGQGGHAIESTRNGIITNTGVIEVNGFQSVGIRLRGGTGVITNSGTITGSYVGPVNLSAPEDGLLLESTSLMLMNSGRIAMSSAASAGVRLTILEAGAATIINTGSISGPASGVLIEGSGGTVNITNVGEMSSTNGHALHIDTALPALSFISNSGTLSAADGTSALQGGIGREEVVNTGTIYGGVNLADGNDLLTLQTGTVLSGTIDGGPGFDDLVLTGDGTLNTSTLNFEELTKFGNGRWRLVNSIVFSSRVRVLEGELSLAAGTLTTAAYAQTADATLSILADPNNSKASIHVNGTATLDGALSVRFASAAPVIDGTRVTAIRAHSFDGIFATAGTGDSINSTFLSATPFVEGTSAGARFTRLPYAVAARSENAVAAANALNQSLSSAPEQAFPLYATLDGQTMANASATLDNIASASPLVLSSLDLLAVRDAAQEVIQHKDQEHLRPQQAGAWGSISRISGSLADGSGTTLDRAATRYAAGVSIPVARGAALSIGLSQTDYSAKTPSTASQMRVDGQALLFSAAIQGHWNQWLATAGVATGSLEGRQVRGSAFDGTLSPGGANDGTAFAASGQITHTQSFGPLHTSLDVNLIYAHIKRDRFTERGNALDTLSYGAHREGSLRGSVGLSGAFNLEPVSPRLRLGVSRELRSSRHTVQAALTALEDRPFELSLKPEERLWITSELQVPFRPHPRFEISLKTGGVLNDKTGGHHFGLQAIWLW